MLKMYDNGGNADMTDLFLDPDERDVHGPGSGTVASLFSDVPGDSCPVELTCNR